MAGSPRIDELKKKFDENPRRYFAPLANEYRKSGDLEQAINLCRTHLPQQPGNLSGHIVFGQALFEAGVNDEARTVFETALGLDPENLIALRHLGDIARAGGDVVSARAWYQRVLDVDPRNEDIAAQMAALSEMPEGAAAPTDEAAGWGDVNPEQAATAVEEAPAAPPVAPPTPPPATRVAPATPAPASAQPKTVPVPAVDRTSVMTPTLRPPTPPPLASMPPVTATPAVQPRSVTPMRPMAPIRPTRPTPGTTPPASTMPTPSSFEIVPEAEAAPLDISIPPAGHRGEDGFAIEKTGEFDADSFATGGEPAAAVPLPDSDPDASALFGDEAWNSPPPPTPPSDLGLEVMEFVPPDREPPHVDTGEYNATHNPALGRMPDESAPAAETPTAFVTETMAELYLQQGFRDEALSVYRQLMSQSPGDASLRERVKQLESGSRSSIAFAAVSEEIASAAQKRASVRVPRSIRSFFGRIAARRAPHREAAAAAEPAEMEQPAAESEFTVAEAPAVTSAAAYVEESFEVVEAPAEAPSPDLPFIEGTEPETLAAEPEPPPPARAVAPPPPPPPPPQPAGAPPRARPSTPAYTSGSVDSLFGGQVSAVDDQAAASLASAFSAQPTPDGGASHTDTPTGGRAARVASTELSLDSVFRDTPRQSRSQRTSASFSFDQFFSEGGGGGQGGGGGASAGGAAGAGGGAAPGGEGAQRESSATDIEQFNAWLEGLKKK